MAALGENQAGRSRPASADRDGGRQPLDPVWAWARYEPDEGRPWTLAMAGHLYRRAAFGGSWEQLERAVADGPQKTIDRLLRPGGDVAAFNRQHDEHEAQPGDSRSADELRAWWLQRMIRTPHPLLEKMTLFWHGYFAASNAKVNSALLMQRHVRLLRSQALGSFRAMLEEIVRDPAMFLSLDARASRKAIPNESFPRWLMGAFTLGPGQYSDKDVREAARAFTGWFVYQDQLREVPREHDPDIKRILGQEGRFSSGDVVRILLEQPATSRMIVRKLYRWLVSETEEPDPRLIAPLAGSFSKNFDVLPLVETMLRSNLFFSRAAYRCRMKCPVEFALGIVKGLEATIPTTTLAEALERMGQNLFHPPTVKGWPGGQNWINQATLAIRHNLAGALLQSAGPFGGRVNPSAVARKYGHSTADAAGRFFADLFMQGDVEPGVASECAQVASSRGAAEDFDQAARAVAHAVITLAEFHLA